MKVILDTNVFISGIFWTGNSNKIIQMWKDKTFTLITSAEILSELIEVLKDFKIQMPEEMIKSWIDLIVRNTLKPTSTPFHNNK
ncbi:MAG: putative toxin-antitoxin system toxin component, PIN family [Nanoarchaeota archaeon]